MLSQRSSCYASGLLFLGLIAALSGCASGSGDPGTGPFICGPKTCTGCCQGNNCVAPPDETACGAGGAACAPCRANEACTQGMCVPDNCAGCVDPMSLSCLPGTAADKCGVGGAFCASCGSGTACQAGHCTSTACAGCKDAGGTCQPGTSNTACGVGGATCAPCTSPSICQDKKCQAPATCNATTCPTGCCDSTDTCKPGTAVAACGAAGGKCESCSGAGATCTAGVCKTPCGPGNCAGCCDMAGKCQASTTASCGNNGVACTACNASSLCSNGKCIDNSCKATCPGCCMGSTCELGNTTGACGSSGNSCVGCVSGQVCSNGACQVDPNSLWDFQVTSATVPGYSMSGSPWDSFSYPDPYIELDLNYGGADQAILYSDWVSDTLTPDYSMTTYVGKVYPAGSSPMGVKASLLLQSSYLQIWDSDGFAQGAGIDDDIGFCAFHINASNFNSGLWMFTCAPANNSVGVSWTVYFRIVPHT